jgi:hypothetical protein
VDRYHVPVEHRVLGLDRRKLPLAAVVVGIIVVMVWVFPLINNAIAWDDEIVAGDVIDMGGGTTFVPPVGWQLERGVRQSDEPITGVNPAASSALIVNGAVTIDVQSSTFSGSTDDLVDQVNSLRDHEDDGHLTINGPRQTFTTDDGLVGISEAYTSESREGRVVAFTWDSAEDGRLGLTVTIDASIDNYAPHAEEIDDMLASITVTEADS